MILDMVKNTTEQALISIVIAKVEDIFKNEATGHDASHTIRVYKTAKKLCDGTGANTLIVSLASLLHDVDDVKIFPTHINDCHKHIGMKSSGKYYFGKSLQSLAYIMQNLISHLISP